MPNGADSARFGEMAERKAPHMPYARKRKTRKTTYRRRKYVRKSAAGARSASRWKRSAVGSGVVYAGTGSRGAYRAHHKPGAIAPARKGETIQDETALDALLGRRIPRIKRADHPYLPMVQSMVHKTVGSGSLLGAAVDDNVDVTASLLSLKLNSAFDPLGDEGSTQGTGYTYLASLYKKYIVTRTELKVTFRNYYLETATDGDPEDIKAFIQFGGANTLNADADTYAEIVNDRSFALGLPGNKGSLKFKLTMRELPVAQPTQAFATDGEDEDFNIIPGEVTINKTWNLARFPADVIGFTDYNHQNATLAIFQAAVGADAGVTVWANIGAAKKGTFETTAMDNPIRCTWEMFQHITWFDPDGGDQLGPN